MCGIAGFLGHYGPDLLEGMNDAQAHRGPDGRGTFHDAQSGVGLAHLRLSIIDTSDAASQPMTGVNGRYQVIFNGAIYNFRELAADLDGYDFNRASDTAILAPMYDRYGPAMVERLNGMFALAIAGSTPLASERVMMDDPPPGSSTVSSGLLPFEMRKIAAIPRINARAAPPSSHALRWLR